MTSSSDIVMMDAVALAGAIRSRRLSCVEVMTACVDQIEKLNPKVNAAVALRDRDALLDEARERDAELVHEWMKGVLPMTMARGPALAVPAGFNQEGLPMGIQIVGPNHAELACLQLAHAYEMETNWTRRRLPGLLQ
jgi:Asp-tRNA(Asn)/Glu-tRNA(Gln) amidotransferase A subunit family amidase